MDFVHPVRAVIPGVQGRVLAVLAETTAELNLSTVSRLAGVSVAQASRVMPGLVELGLVQRREVPPSALFRLIQDNVAARAVLWLARSRDIALELLGAAAGEMTIRPASVILFGSLARGEAEQQSDVDVIMVRPGDIDEDDERWADAIDQWRRQARAITGNRVEVLEVDDHEIAFRLKSRSALWRDVARDGVVIHGLTIAQLRETVHA